MAADDSIETTAVELEAAVASEAPTADHARPRRRRPTLARAIVGGLAVIVAVGLVSSSLLVVRRTEQLEDELSALRAEAPTKAMIERLAGGIGSNQDVSAETILGTNLSPPTALPKTHRSVPSALSTRLARATVRLGIRPHHPQSSDWPAGWNNWCSATVVTEGGHTLALTAAHCFDVLLRLDDIDWERTDADAREVSRRLDYDFAVLDPTSLVAEPLALLGQVAMPVNQHGDWALATIADGLPSTIGSIELDLTRRATPHPGDGVQQHTYTSRDEGHPIESKGIYLGRSTDVITGRTSDIELVAINPKAAADDACFFGASGSSAALADGHITGPASVRSTIGYGPKRTIESEDADSGRVGWQRLQLEDATHIDLSRTTVVCGYAAYDSVLLDSLLALLGISASS